MKTIILMLMLSLHTGDWMQTRQIAESSRPRMDAYGRMVTRHYHETNPILGKHPSKDKVDLYFTIGGVAKVGGLYLLPRPYDFLWGGAWILINLRNVVHNKSIGLTLKF
jgi:hypothetical protein